MEQNPEIMLWLYTTKTGVRCVEIASDKEFKNLCARAVNFRTSFNLSTLNIAVVCHKSVMLAEAKQAISQWLFDGLETFKVHETS